MSPQRLSRELGETVQRSQLGGPFYVVAWLLAAFATGLHRNVPWVYVAGALVFAALAGLRRIVARALPAEAGIKAMQRELDRMWAVLLVGFAAWGAASAALVVMAQGDTARMIPMLACFALAITAVYTYCMRPWRALASMVLTFAPMLAASFAVHTAPEFTIAGLIYMVYLVALLRRSQQEYDMRLQLEDELREQRDLFEQQSRRDGLTGLANRRRFSGALADWVAKTGEGGALALLLLDLDHFKSINDQHGHAVGDACLRAFAEQLQHAFPASGELVARLGGEEFGVLLRDVGRNEAMLRADAFRRQFAERALATEGGELHSSVSIGVALFDPRRDADGEALYRAADAALYRAKATGRNTVQAAEPA